LAKKEKEGLGVERENKKNNERGKDKISNHIKRERRKVH